jgi:hypothetical protein
MSGTFISLCNATGGLSLASRDVSSDDDKDDSDWVTDNNSVMSDDGESGE